MNKEIRRGKKALDERYNYGYNESEATLAHSSIDVY